MTYNTVLYLYLLYSNISIEYNTVNNGVKNVDFTFHVWSSLCDDAKQVSNWKHLCMT